jgi:flagellar biosynthesis protein FlhB
MLKLKKKKGKTTETNSHEQLVRWMKTCSVFWHVAISISERLTELLKKYIYSCLSNNLVKKIIVNLNIFSLLSIHFLLFSFNPYFMLIFVLSRFVSSQKLQTIFFLLGCFDTPDSASMCTTKFWAGIFFYYYGGGEMMVFVYLLCCFLKLFMEW